MEGGCGLGREENGIDIKWERGPPEFLLNTEQA